MAEKLDQRGFEERFPNIIETAKHVEHAVVNGFHVILKKPIKSGARKLIEDLALRNTEHLEEGCPSVSIIHIYITKLVRKDTKEQLLEMSGYGIYCYAIENVSHLDETIALIEGKLQDCRVWVHLDEADYGSKIDQVLSKLFYRIIDDSNCRIINYSATNEEALLSSFNNANFVKVVQLIPGEHFKGPGWFLDQNLVKQSEPFWDFNSNCLTKQGLEAIALLEVSPDKFFGVIRLPDYQTALNDPSFTKFFNDKGIEVLFIDNQNKFVWSNEGGKGDWKRYAYDKKKVLLIINQTCTRSTEVGFHKHIVFWHDYRSGNTAFNTRCQAYERNNHYDESGHHIVIYADIPTYELSAGRISCEEYVEVTGFPISDRISATVKQKKYDREFYIEDDPEIATIKDSIHGRPLVKFKDQRKVPEPYKSHGNEQWNSSLTSKWNSTEPGRDPLRSIMNGVPRTNKEPLLCIVGPNANNPLSHQDFLKWCRDNNIKANDGRSVEKAINNNKRVFYHAKPLTTPCRKLTGPISTKKDQSMYQ